MRPLRLAAGAALALGTTVGLRRGLHRRSVLARRVAPDLRSPMLYRRGGISTARGLRLARFIVSLPPAPLPEHVTERRTPDGIRVLVYDLVDRPRPSGVLVWVHGGGYVMGRPEENHPECVELAREAGVLVVNVDYRLAPEHPFPAALDDCISVVRWIVDEAASLGIDPDRIAIGGASAGGGVAAAVCQKALDEAGPPLAFQLLLYPMIDDRTALRTDLDPDGVHVWSPQSNRYGWTSYLGRPPVPDEAPPYAAPARRTDLGGLPPAWIGVGDIDLFHPEDVDYARRLRDAGVPCELHTPTGMWHGAPTFKRDAPTTVGLRQSMAAALADAVGVRSRPGRSAPRG